MKRAVGVIAAALLGGLFGVLNAADEAGTIALSQKNLAGTWKGLWVTPATKFTFELEFTVDEKGRVSGKYGHPGQKKSPGLGGTLTLGDAETGAVSGTLTFGPKVVFQSQDGVRITAVTDAEKAQRGPFRLKGIFKTAAFPGDLGIDDLDVYGGTP